MQSASFTLVNLLKTYLPKTGSADFVICENLKKWICHLSLKSLCLQTRSCDQLTLNPILIPRDGGSTVADVCRVNSLGVKGNPLSARVYVLLAPLLCEKTIEPWSAKPFIALCISCPGWSSPVSEICRKPWSARPCIPPVSPVSSAIVINCCFHAHPMWSTLQGKGTNVHKVTLISYLSLVNPTSISVLVQDMIWGVRIGCLF